MLAECVGPGAAPGGVEAASVGAGVVDDSSVDEGELARGRTGAAGARRAHLLSRTVGVAVPPVTLHTWLYILLKRGGGKH